MCTGSHQIDEAETDQNELKKRRNHSAIVSDTGSEHQYHLP